METDYQRIPESMHPKSFDENAASNVKVLLNAIRESKFAYEEDKNTIDFDIAIKGLNGNTYDDIIAIISNFSDLRQLTQTISEMQIVADLLFACNSTIQRLKYIPKYGELYYDIITRYYINEEFANADAAAEAFHLGRRTFFRRLDAAIKQLHKIWFVTTPQYMEKCTASIYTQLSL